MEWCKMKEEFKEATMDYEKDLRTFFGEFIYEKVSDVEIVILITKKAYWSYKVLKDERSGSDLHTDVKWYSDRYFQKKVEFSEFDGKKIVIVDDTINTGKTLKSFYDFIRKYCPLADVTPMVCYVNGESIVNSKEEGNEFWEKLIVKEEVTPEKIGKMCVYETWRFHNQLVPYIVDLPVVRDATKKGIDFSVKISREKFERISYGNSVWSYSENSYDLMPGYRQKFGFFEFIDGLVYKKFEPILQDIVIKVQYLENAGQVLCVFTPFAFLESVKADELYQCFRILFGETEYGRNLLETPSDDGLMTNYYTAMYRAVVYYLSMYAGVKFLKFLNLDMELELVNEGEFSEQFYQSINKIFPMMNRYEGFDESKFISQLALMPKFSRVYYAEDNMINHIENNLSKYLNVEWRGFFYDNIISTMKGSDTKVLYITERFREILKMKLKAEDDREVQYAISKEMLEALNKSLLTNYLEYDKTTKTVYRGYKHGENIELLLPCDARLFYQAILSYYEKVGEERYFKYLDIAMVYLKDFLQEQGFMGYLIEEQDYRILTRHFQSVSKEYLTTQIENKRYMLDAAWCNQSVDVEHSLEKIKRYFEDLVF